MNQYLNKTLGEMKDLTEQYKLMIIEFEIKEYINGK